MIDTTLPDEGQLHTVIPLADLRSPVMDSVVRLGVSDVASYLLPRRRGFAQRRTV